MCQFNFIVLKISGEHEITQVLSELNLKITPVKIVMQNKELRTYLTNTEDECHCASIVGKKETQLQKFDFEKERKKLERKRFSKARIEFLLSQFQSEFMKTKARKKLQAEIEADNYKMLVTQILKTKIGPVGLFYKQFRDAIHNEQIIEIEIEAKSQITPEFLKEMIEGNVYWFNSASR